jgi:hypothetical protein
VVHNFTHEIPIASKYNSLLDLQHCKAFEDNSYWKENRALFIFHHPPHQDEEHIKLNEMVIT